MHVMCKLKARETGEADPGEASLMPEYNVPHTSATAPEQMTHSFSQTSSLHRD